MGSFYDSISTVSIHDTSLILMVRIVRLWFNVTYMAGMPRVTHSFFRVIWFACVWVLWKERNNCIFQETVSSSLDLLEKVKLLSFLWLKANQASFHYCYHDWWRYPLPCMGVH
ncbi:hypothetical protein MTR_7g013900 [Medicago truncatula]|uniref:Uncharacterized protein n=1 Tax=Medicago truncatula TaxID=3880 RepID=A0A072TXR2_MEDTR|nr:hypothetical protein MTR_7g013900 [Medicago truncatula]